MGFVDVYDSYTCWCFDEAVQVFGQEIEYEVSQVKGKNEKTVAGRKENVLRRFLGLEQKFRSPGAASPPERQEAPFRME